MQHVHLDSVPWMEWSSTTGRFHGAGKQVSEVLGANLNANLVDGGHPFDLEYGKLPPGKAGCPFHSHSAQWECYYIVSGTGTMRYGDQRRQLRAGDIALHPPGSSHQLINTGDNDLLYYLVADNPTSEFWHYPDSDKYGFKPGGVIFRKTDAHYDLGEDDPPGEPLVSEARKALPEMPAQFINVAANTPDNWLFGISPEGIGTLGMLLNFSVSLAVSAVTPPPPQDIQVLVEQIRLPGEPLRHQGVDIQMGH